MKKNLQLEKIRESTTVALSDRILALKASGRKIIPLHVGDPDFETPRAIIDKATEALRHGETHYTSSRGDRDLKLGAAEKYLREVGISYDPEREIQVTHGGIHAYYLALQSILNPGDEVLIPDPSWATHSNMVTLLRGRIKRVSAPAEKSFIPDIESWAAALTSKTRALVVNYPSNPTGVYPSKEYLQKLQNFAAENNLWVVSDEVYQNLYYGEKPTSLGAFPEAKERTILINSFSKSYAMTGWRVGYLMAPKSIIKNAVKASQNSITCVAPFIQKAAAFALSDAGVQKEAETIRAAYARRRTLVMRIASEYSKSPLKLMPPQGAFYFFLDLRFLARTSLQISEQILETEGVALVPGSAFGKEGEGFVRMTIAASDEDIEAGIRAIFEWVEEQ
ncbi:MAG: pyridoxal phosphate-dependent aminotransferase [Anaerolineae bacterium]|jgi:aspartate/methionine/tyrosine aminotransferase|nr:pyridoxal phosphate-dependent aminotransferase [Anaerolineae bacterium]MBT7073773.1 pyridoxal phosphate-dependent aminotransferase [Anaerolineae bacterium]MBT7783555.1 pyridoxal phosphate-dependent aminotransferase [Anaerolineae bacterium]